MSIRVISRRPRGGFPLLENEIVFYVGRPTSYRGLGIKTALGNPYELHGNPALRDKVCNQHKEFLNLALSTSKKSITAPGTKKTYLVSNIIQDLENIAEVAKVKNVALLCFCAPYRCHGDTIKQVVEEILITQIRSDIERQAGQADEAALAKLRTTWLAVPDR